MAQTDCVLSPIGYIRAGDSGFVLEVKPEFRKALLGMDGFSHINVLWWSHYLDNPESRAVLTCDKPYKKAPEQLGIFATRSPQRPNPVCLTVSQVLYVDETNGRIGLAYTDAEDGSPVLDIKPYVPCSDRVKTVSTPAWSSHWPAWYEDSATFDWPGEFVNAR